MVVAFVPNRIHKSRLVVDRVVRRAEGRRGEGEMNGQSIQVLGAAAASS